MCRLRETQRLLPSCCQRHRLDFFVSRPMAIWPSRVKLTQSIIVFRLKHNVEILGVSLPPPPPPQEKPANVLSSLSRPLALSATTHQLDGKCVLPHATVRIQDPSIGSVGLCHGRCTCCCELGPGVSSPSPLQRDGRGRGGGERERGGGEDGKHHVGGINLSHPPPLVFFPTQEPVN